MAVLDCILLPHLDYGTFPNFDAVNHFFNINYQSLKLAAIPQGLHVQVSVVCSKVNYDFFASFVESLQQARPELEIRLLQLPPEKSSISRGIELAMRNSQADYLWFFPTGSRIEDDFFVEILPGLEQGFNLVKASVISAQRMVVVDELYETSLKTEPLLLCKDFGALICKREYLMQHDFLSRMANFGANDLGLCCAVLDILRRDPQILEGQAFNQVHVSELNQLEQAESPYEASYEATSATGKPGYVSGQIADFPKDNATGLPKDNAASFPTGGATGLPKGNAADYAAGELSGAVAGEGAKVASWALEHKPHEMFKRGRNSLVKLQRATADNLQFSKPFQALCYVPRAKIVLYEAKINSVEQVKKLFDFVGHVYRIFHPSLRFVALTLVLMLDKVRACETSALKRMVVAETCKMYMNLLQLQQQGAISSVQFAQLDKLLDFFSQLELAQAFKAQDEVLLLSVAQHRELLSAETRLKELWQDHECHLRIQESLLKQLAQDRIGTWSTVQTFPSQNAAAKQANLTLSSLGTLSQDESPCLDKGLCLAKSQCLAKCQASVENQPQFENPSWANNQPRAKHPSQAGVDTTTLSFIPAQGTQESSGQFPAQEQVQALAQAQAQAQAQNQSQLQAQALTQVQTQVLAQNHAHTLESLVQCEAMSSLELANVGAKKNADTGADKSADKSADIGVEYGAHEGQGERDAVHIVTVVNNQPLFERFFVRNPCLAQPGVYLHPFLNPGADGQVRGLSELYNRFIEDFCGSQDQASAQSQDPAFTQELFYAQAEGQVQSQAQAEGWLVFCHNDVEILDDIQVALAHLSHKRIYGPCGAYVRIKEHQPVFSFLNYGMTANPEHEFMLNGNPKALFRLFPKEREKYVVDTFDCLCVIVHSSLVKQFGLRFDEHLRFDLVVEDFCLNAAQNHGVVSQMANVLMIHHSSSSALNLPPSYYASLKYLNAKYPHLLAAGTCSLIGGAVPPENYFMY